MSIITNALKKAQELNQVRQKKNTYSPKEFVLVGSSPTPTLSNDTNNLSEKNPHTLRDDTRSHKFIIAAIMIAVLGIVAGLLLYIHSQLSHTKQDLTIEKPIMEKAPIIRETQKIATKPSIASPTKLPNLTGIMHSPTNPQAVINGKIVAKGESIGGFLVLEIFTDKVKISSAGIESELVLR